MLVAMASASFVFSLLPLLHKQKQKDSRNTHTNCHDKCARGFVQENEKRAYDKMMSTSNNRLCSWNWHSKQSALREWNWNCIIRRLRQLFLHSNLFGIILEFLAMTTCPCRHTESLIYRNKKRCHSVYFQICSHWSISFSPALMQIVSKYNVHSLPFRFCVFFFQHSSSSPSFFSAFFIVSSATLTISHLTISTFNYPPFGVVVDVVIIISGVSEIIISLRS